MHPVFLIVILSGCFALASAACGSYPIVNNATATLNKGYLLYTCLSGYTFADGSNFKNVSCSGNQGLWSAVDATCTAKPLCSNLTLTPAMSIDSTDKYAGAVVNVRCDTGAQYKANQQRVQAFTCQPSGFWDRVVLPCSNVTCPLFPVTGAVQNISDGLGSYGSVSTWTCGFGLAFPGGLKNLSATCSATGLWSVLPPKSGCQAGVCASGWATYARRCYSVSDAVTGVLRRDAAAASCRTKGGQLANIDGGGENDFLAQVTGVTSAKTLAEASVGYWIGAWTSGSGIWFEADSSGAAVNITYSNWMLGYPEGLGNCAELSSGGFWKDKPCDRLDPYICERPQACGVPPVIQNGAALLPSDNLTTGDNGLILTYSCNQGYWFSNRLSTASVSCSGDGGWSYVESCQAVYCPPVFIKNGYISSRNIRSDTTNATLVLNCKPGYATPSGKITWTVTCQVNGSWQPDVSQECVPVSCPLPALANAIASQNVSRSGMMDFYTCQQGYQLQDNSTQISVTCMPDGTWYPNTIGCQRQACPPFVAFNATTSNGSAFYQDSVQVTCLKGYRLAPGVTSSTVTCLAGGTWSSDVLTCQAYYCAQPPPNVAYADKSTNESMAGTQVTYTCVDGYQISTSNDQPLTAVCDLAQAMWVFQQNSECTPSPLNDTTPLNALIEWYGSVSVAALVLLLSLAALIGSAMQPVYDYGGDVENERIAESHQLDELKPKAKDIDTRTPVVPFRA